MLNESNKLNNKQPKPLPKPDNKQFKLYNKQSKSYNKQSKPYNKQSKSDNKQKSA